MGTRSVSAAVVDGEYKIAKYCQWDGYPSGVGAEILELLKSIDLKVLKDKIIQNAEFASDEYIDEAYKNLGIKINDGWVNMDDSSKFEKRYPLLDRSSNLADVLIAHISNPHNNTIYTKNSINFATDSLFCEYGYIVDFDKNVFEVYTGSNSVPLKENERFFSSESVKSVNGDEYYPISLISFWDFDHLPSLEDFLENLEEDQESIN